MIYLDGSIIKSDRNKAYALLRQAAEQGHIQSKTYLISDKLMSSAAVSAKAVGDIIDIVTDNRLYPLFGNG